MSLDYLSSKSTERLNEIEDKCRNLMRTLEASFGMKYILSDVVSDCDYYNGYAECGMMIDGYYQPIYLIFDIITHYNLVINLIVTAKILPSLPIMIIKQVPVKSKPVRMIDAKCLIDKKYIA